MVIFEEQYLSNPSDNSQADWCAWKPKSRAFAYTKFYDHAQNSHGLLSESISDWFTREMAMFEEQNLSNQSELGHAILRVWKPYMRAFS